MPRSRTEATEGRREAPHPLHVTYGRVAVERETILVSVRFFADDLTDTFRAFARRGDDLVLAPTPEVDAIALRYLATRLGVVANGAPLTPRLAGSSEDGPTWTYRVEYRSTRPIRRLRLCNRLLFETFADQRNLAQVAVFPSGRERTYFFAAGDDVHDIAL